MKPTGSFALRLDDEITLLAGAAGGDLFAEVVPETGSPGPFVAKHLGSVGVEDISLEVGAAMSNALFDWIAASWQGQEVLKDGAVLSVSYALAIVAVREFQHTRIGATTIPALDVASTSPGRLSLLLSPGASALHAGSGKLEPAKLRQKLWLASTFRLDIDGIDCTKVSRIAEFTVAGPVDGKVDFPDLEVTLAATADDTWRAWFEDFVVNGNNSDAHERAGKITFLLPNLQTPLATVKLEGLGIFRLSTESGGPAQVPRTTAGLYCERMSLEHGGGTP